MISDCVLAIASSILAFFTRIGLLTSAVSLSIYGKLWTCGRYLSKIFNTLGSWVEIAAVRLSVSFLHEWSTLRSFISKKIYQSLSILWLVVLGLTVHLVAKSVPMAACFVLVLAFYYFLRLE